MLDRPNKERVCATIPTEHPVINVGGLSSIESSSRLVAQIISRARSCSLIRDWRLIYQLRDLPANVYLTAGLLHLPNIIEGINRCNTRWEVQAGRSQY